MTQLDSDDVENIKARCPQSQQNLGYFWMVSREVTTLRIPKNFHDCL